MVIFNFTNIVLLFVFNCASEHCAVTSELSKLGDWPIVHRDDDLLGARILFSQIVINWSRLWKTCSRLASNSRQKRRRKRYDVLSGFGLKGLRKKRCVLETQIVKCYIHYTKRDSWEVLKNEGHSRTWNLNFINGWFA